MKIAFLGLGSMGGAMARNLVKAGHSVIVWNRSAEPVRAHRRRLARRSAPTPAKAAAEAEIAITMLADDARGGGRDAGRERHRQRTG